MPITKSRRKTYGNTWWGRSWIEALEQIDDARLKRGKTYANTGKVLNLDVSDNVVAARVSGKYSPYYETKMTLQKFNPDQIALLKKLIQDNPSLSSELSLGKLPESLLDFCAEYNIDLLPKQWSDIKSSCTCFDWANPCKHLAATYYMLANEIDKDPLLLLKLRGLKDELFVKKITESQILFKRLDDLEDDFMQEKPVLKEEQASFDQDRNINLFVPRFNMAKLLSLLEDNPSFHSSSNFKDTLENIYKVAMSNAYNLFPEEFDAKSKLSSSQFDFSFHKEAKTYIDAFKFSVDDSGQEETIENLKNSLVIDFNKSTSSFSFYRSLLQLAVESIKAGVFVPEIIFIDEKSFSIRYTVLSNQKQVKSILHNLNQIYKIPTTSIKEQVSFFVTYFIHKIFKRENKQNLDKLSRVFITKEIFTPASFEDNNLAKSLSNWLLKLHLEKESIRPMLRIENTDQDLFSIYIDVINNQESLGKIFAYKEIFKSKTKKIFSQDKEKVALNINKQLSILGEEVPEISQIINSKGKDPAQIDLTRLGQILENSIAVLDILGIQIILPKELRDLVKPKIKVKARTKQSNTGSLELEDLLDFSYEIAIGDKSISAKEFNKLVKNADGLVKYKDQYLFLKPEQAKAILNQLDKPLPNVSNSMEALFVGLAGEINGLQFEVDKSFDKFVKKLTKLETVRVPSTLNATLRPYQERGFKWLYSNAKKGLGSCIADDMGLGKTIQVITLLLKSSKRTKDFKSSLVICPTTLIGNWAKECEKFAPKLKLNIYHGSKRKLQANDIDLVLTSYGTLRRDFKKFEEKDWNFLIIDEAQNIKNTNTKQTKAIKALKANNRIAMTGTPVENRLSELWSVFDFINKGYLKSEADFNDIFSTPIERYRDEEKIETLQKVTSPFMLRRLKTDKEIISDLPEKITQDEYCYLSKEQAAIYQNIVKDAMSNLDDTEGIERKGLIFKLITALKQISNHPANFSKQANIASKESGKSQRLISLLENIIDTDEKALIFTQYTEMGNILVQMIEEELGEKALFFHGKVSRKKRDQMVEDFQNQSNSKIMIISLKAGGTGLNLTKANHVIHYDLWWNPAVENQATDRAFRIGQNKNVMVHRLVTLGTFEEKINEIIKSKQELANLTVSVGEKWITEMSNQDLKEIFSLTK
ncbi:MAG: DEAD/DEAH box helicase [Candidatus Caenarcaniphilales bacterium]|nr:DEAD/DEAH box helicase [Candidatus Caenarcaniphilales bacterium]